MGIRLGMNNPNNANNMTLSEVKYRAQQDCLKRQKTFTEKRRDLKVLTRAQFEAKWGAV